LNKHLDNVLIAVTNLKLQKNNMKKLLSISMLFISVVMYSQEDYYGNTLDDGIYEASQIVLNPNVKPPDVAAFEKVNFVPVSNYTGRANISIPIYEVSAGKMSVPISLSYNSTGVKVAEMASSVGLGWSLNAGGMITKNIKGIDDFQRAVKANDPSPYMTPSGWLGYTNADYYIYTLSRYNDAEPDVFSVNAPGISTKYIHNKQYHTNSDGTVSLGSTNLPERIELEHQGTIIEETLTGSMTSSGFSNIKVTSINGIVYNFGAKDMSTYNSGYATNGAFSYNTKTEGYRLDTMYDPSSNQTITFEYEQYAVNFFDPIPVGINSYGGGTNLHYSKTSNSSTTYPITHRLTKILFDKGYVEFIYGINRLDNLDEKALTEIKVVDSNGNLIKHFKLNYGYFQSTIESDKPQSKRLRLDRVYEVDTNLNELPGYTFTYDTSVQMPPRTSYAHDFLGYNNGTYVSTNTDPIPKLYFYNNKIYPISVYASSIELTGNFSLEANESYAKAYSLTKITYPTGGSNTYEYESNEFLLGSIHKGGGLRLKTQTLDDGKGGLQILDYEYGSGQIGKLPSYASFRLNKETYLTPTTLSELQYYLGIDTYMTPQSQTELNNGSFVGYSIVTVKNRLDNGFSKYFYTNVSDYPNISSTKTVDNSFEINKSWNKIAPQALSIDQDYLRGKVKYEEVYNKNGEFRLQKIYKYTQKEFRNISLDYINKASYLSSLSSGYCYSSGVYYCNYYKESVNLPIARNLLTTVITKDYQADKVVYTQGGPENVPYTFQTVQKYLYDADLPLVLRESKSSSSVFIPDTDIQNETQDYYYLSQGDSKVIKDITYPKVAGSGNQDQQIPPAISPLPYANELINQNRLSTPMTITLKNENNEVMVKEEHYYNLFGILINLEKINFINRDNSITESEIVTKKDFRGRILEYQKKDGIYVSRFYGYDDEYLIAEVENSTYSNMISKLQNLQTPFNQGTTADPASIRAMMSELRVALPDARITSYTYAPLIGVTSITDQRGETIYYEYDNFNRLKSVKDSDGNILSENEYHYKNQQ
jgi:YD repeat-containing protein